MPNNKSLLSILVIIPVLFMLVGCGATNVERKTTGGVGLGALAGGVMSGSVGGAAAGAAIGGLAGYAIGTDQDRHAEKMALEKERNEIAKAKITSDPKTAYRPANRNDLVGTTWRVISIEGEQPFPEYHSLVTTFQTNSKVTTLVVNKDGSASTVAESYQILNDVMVVSGEENGKKYVVDGKYNVQDGTFIYVTPTYRVVGEKVN
jgi:osmotically inducible lipoprotein OsmB